MIADYTTSELKRKISYYKNTVKNPAVSSFYRKNAELLIADLETELANRKIVNPFLVTEKTEVKTVFRGP